MKKLLLALGFVLAGLAPALAQNAAITMPTTVTVNTVACTLGSSCTITASATQITVGTTTVSGGTNGDIEFNNSGVLGEKAVTGSGSVVLGTSPSISGLTVTGSFTATGLVTNADLANASTTVNGTTCTLGSTCTITTTAGSITVGTTTITSGSTGKIEFNNAGVLGEKSVTGTGSVVLDTSPTFTGTLTFGSNVAGAFGTAGVNLVGSAYTQTDSTTAAGTVATAYGSVRNAATFATAANAVTITNAYGGYYVAPIAGAHTTFTNGWALGADSLRVVGATEVGSLGVGAPPTNAFDIVGNQNSAVVGRVVNNSGGAAAYASFRTENNSGNTMVIGNASNGYTATGVLNPSTGFLQSTSNMAILSGGAIQFAANNSTAEVARFINDGSSAVFIVGLGLTQKSIRVEHITGSASGTDFEYFTYNASQIGGISQSGTTAVAFNTTSDQRLKNDLGIASSVAALERLKVHNFIWKANGKRDLGVFAQEAYKVKPNAVRVGGADPKKNPWQVDYSKFVPDLIVGWQNHEARLAELERKVANDDMRERLDPYAHAFCISKLCIGWK